MKGSQLLLNLINSKNPWPLLATDLAFGEPEATEGEANTTLLITGAEGGRYPGEQTIHYNRVDIAEHFAVNGIEVVQIARASSEDVLAALKARYNFELDEEDVGDIVVGDDAAIIEIGAGSYAYLGALEIEIVDVAENDLAVLFVNTTLNGFDLVGYQPT